MEINTINDLKSFLAEQAIAWNITPENCTTSNTQLPEGIDEQLAQYGSTDDIGSLFYIERSGTPTERGTVEMKTLKLDLRGDEPVIITREEWIALQGLK